LPWVGRNLPKFNRKHHEFPHGIASLVLGNWDFLEFIWREGLLTVSVVPCEGGFVWYLTQRSRVGMARLLGLVELPGIGEALLYAEKNGG
jgi:hypothetical protein